jgi:hypothetical protein
MIMELEGNLEEIFGIELVAVETVPQALTSLITALSRSPSPDAKPLREALGRLEQVSAPLGRDPAAALLRGFEIIGQRSQGKTARKLGLMAAALRQFVPALASDDEVIALWNEVIALSQKQRGREWSATTSAWLQGLATLKESMGRLS